MTKDLGRAADAEPALVSDQAPAGPAPSGFDPAREWEIHFEARAGRRVLRSRFLGIVVGWGHAGADTLWWDMDNRQWRTEAELFVPNRKYAASSSAPCRSFKAFKRHLRRHRAMLAGREVRLTSRFVGHDVCAIPCGRPS